MRLPDPLAPLWVLPLVYIVLFFAGFAAALLMFGQTPAGSALNAALVLLLLGALMLLLYSAHVQWHTSQYPLTSAHTSTPEDSIQTDPRRPIVSVWLAPHPHNLNLIDVVVHNSGLQPARQVAFLLSNHNPHNDSPYAILEEKMQQMHLFSKGLATLGPAAQRRSFLCDCNDLFELYGTLSLDAQMNVSALFCDDHGRQYEQTSLLDWNELKGSCFVAPAHPAAEPAPGVVSEPSSHNEPVWKMMD